MPTKSCLSRPVFLFVVLCLLAGFLEAGSPDHPTASSRASFCSPDFQNFLSYQAGHRRADDSMANYQAKGWINLINIFSAPDCREQLPDYLQQWLDRFTSHEALALVRQLRQSTVGMQPQKVAVLLPAEAAFADQIKQIRQGLLQAAADRHVTLEFVSTATGNPEQWRRHILQAGHQCVVGPLLKENVIDFASSVPGLPVLALNHLPELMDYPSHFLQIALAPEDQVKSLLSLLRKQNLHRGILFMQDAKPWSSRIAKNLYRGWLLEAGQWTAVSTFADSPAVATLKMSEVLEIEQSQQRAERLEQLLGEPLEYQQRRRQDIDFVVFVGDYADVKRLYPYLRFWHGSQIPAFLLSPELPLADAGLEYDLDGLNLFIPAWLNQKNLLDKDISAVNLYQFAYQAMTLAIDSGCLQLPAVYLHMQKAKNWYLQADTGQIGYRNVPAVIQRNQLKVLSK